MKQQRLYGPMGSRMKQHLELRRSLGFIYRSAEYVLHEFDQYLANNFPSSQIISRQMITGYLDTIRHKHPMTLSGKVGILRQFCRFMFQFDTNTYIPEKGLVSRGPVQIKPHIFTEAEINNLIKHVSSLHGNIKLLPETYRTIIGLLWVTGMRIGEVVNLKIDDVDTNNGIIYVRQTKFFKSRMLPLSESTNQALIKYKQQRLNYSYSEAPGTPFFYNDRGKPCLRATTATTIKGLIIQSGIKTFQGKTPRVHDIRHSFATRWLLDFYQSGKDPTAYLATLATYMGHASIANTQVYLHPSIELLNIASNQVQTYILSTGENNETRK